MDLKDIIATDDEVEPLWVACPLADGFQVHIRPLGDKQAGILEQAREVGWDEATMERRVTINEEIYQHLMGEHMIAGWKGLTTAALKKLVLVKNPKKLAGFTGEIACEPEARDLLMKHSAAFTNWVVRISGNIELFNREREAAQKKT